ncbi:BEL1-like homeodomain protein 9 isoform X1 [Zingiber officinale]|uniref:BEL1-like homeodomain protein 9 isoform X1 n=1 Tax=Zingiber officinale TaxID=94328 RepID=UPI001C4BAE2A|nr:BEL1-like homeodomain protein 9 isoform X1 [Zingiber officinale]
MASAAAAAAANRLAGGAGEEQEEEQSAFLRDHRRSCYHVPQQSRREKLRFPTHSSLSIDSSSSRIGRSAPHGPFTGYAAVLGRSRFLQPALRLLEEVCQVGQQRRRAGSLGDALLGADMTERKEFSPVTGGEHRRRKTRLNCLLDEVHRRYKQYYHQMQAVVTSFEAVAGLSNAAPYASMALEAMTKHFSGLGSIISGQLRPTTDGLGNEGVNREPTASSSLLNRSCCFHGPPAAEAVATFAQPHFWRPQRGLPERAVAVLRAWLFEHFLHPYPTDVDKQNLAKQTGLTRNQVKTKHNQIRPKQFLCVRDSSSASSLLIRFLTGLSTRECEYGSRWSRKCTPWRCARRARCLEMAIAASLHKSRPRAQEVAPISTHRRTFENLHLNLLIIAGMESHSRWDSTGMLEFTFPTRFTAQRSAHVAACTRR